MSPNPPVALRPRRPAILWVLALCGLFLLMFGFLRRSVWLGLFGLTNDLTGINPFFDPDMPLVTFLMFLHMITGGALCVLAPFQMIGPLRRRWPGLHRWMGRGMIALGGITGLGGLLYAIAHGTTGGRFMDLSTTVYGLLILTAAGQTLRHG